MDPKLFIEPFRALHPLILVVSNEPLDVAEALAHVLKDYMEHARAFTRQGSCSLLAYIGGLSLSFRNPKEPLSPEAMLTALEKHQGQAPDHPDHFNGQAVREGKRTVAVTALDDALKLDPKADFVACFAPDLWPALGDLHVLAGLQRFRDQRSVDPHCIKNLVVVSPSLDFVPEPLRPLFTVIYDRGLTQPQASAKISFWLKQYRAPEPQPGDLEFLANVGVGASSSALAQALATAIVRQRKSFAKDGSPVDPALLRACLPQQPPPDNEKASLEALVAELYEETWTEFHGVSGRISELYERARAIAERQPPPPAAEAKEEPKPPILGHIFICTETHTPVEAAERQVEHGAMAEVIFEGDILLINTTIEPGVRLRLRSNGTEFEIRRSTLNRWWKDELSNPRTVEPPKDLSRTTTVGNITIEEAPGDFCGGSGTMTNGQKCPGCRACR